MHGLPRELRAAGSQSSFSRRSALSTLGGGAAALGTLSTAFSHATATQPAAAAPPADDRPLRIGVISAAIEGKPQRLNGHTWQFCQPFHADLDLDAAAKVNTPQMAAYYRQYFRSLPYNFGDLPFPDTRLTHIHAAHEEVMDAFTQVFRGVEKAPSCEKMVEEVDAVWLGDASGLGEDHFELLAPALEKGLPVFCDKPIGASVAGTKKILDYARKYGAPLMSSSIFCHQWGTAEAVRMRDSGEFGALNYAICAQAGDCPSLRSWLIYGHHPIWMLLTLCGAGVEAVGSYHRANSLHAWLTYPDRMPAEAWYGRPDIVGSYCETTAYFQKHRSKKFAWTPAIEGNFDIGHVYEIYRMADVFRKMIRTRVEPVPHSTILEVTAIIHAAVKSQQEKSRLVALEEVLG